ncbi:MAG: insulinase family protein [candidate division WOR-3 bacterium]|nr:MAG: insulinase family protein [candidate division WOR-3 bacterium]
MIKAFIILFPIFVSFATDIQRDTLDNGLVILTVEAHRIPVVEMRAYVRAGSVLDPSGKEGLANLTGQCLIRGTGQYSYGELVESIESVGGEFTPFVTEDYAGFNGKVLSKDLGRLIDILESCLQHPEFDSLELLRLKRETISLIKVRSDNPFEVSEKGFRSLLFGDHPLGHFPEGIESSVAAITAPEARDFYDTYYRPNNTFLIFVGDFIKDSLLMMLRSHFELWKRQEMPKLEFVEPAPIDRSKAKVIPMDISQAYILLGNFGPRYGEADWNAARVMNYVLGGAGLTSRISGTIREEKGLAYIAYSSFRRFINGGYFAAEVQTKKEMVNEAVTALIQEMEKIRDTIHVEEVARAKKFYTGYLPLAYDTYGEMASIIASIEIDDLGLDYLSRFEDYIRALTISDLQTAAKKYLHPERFYLLIVGDVDPEDIALDKIDWVQ